MINETLLMEHQKRCLKISRDHKRFGIMLGTGTGKTRIGLSIAWDEIDKNPKNKVLVLTKLSIIPNWIEEAGKIGFPFRIQQGWGRTSAERKDRLNSRHDVLVLNYDSFKLETQFLAGQGYTLLLCDESSAIKSHSTKTSKSVVDFSRRMERCYLLSATPAPNGEHEWYMQMQCLREWPTGYGPFTENSFYQFRGRWFYKPNPFNEYKWDIDPGKREAFVAKLAERCIFIKKHECIDLPEQLYETRACVMSDEEQKAYNDMEKDWIIKWKGATTIAENALVEAMKLRQVTGGFSIPTFTARDADDDSAGPVENTPVQIGTSKMRVLSEILEELGDEQAIILIQFRHEAFTIHKELGDKAALVIGGINKTDRDQAIMDFRNKKLQYLIGHPQSMAHGLNLQNCSYTIWYSLAYGPEYWTQANDRTYRKDQTRNCTYLILQAVKQSGGATIDKDIYDSLTGKVKLSTALLERLQRDDAARQVA